MMDILHFIRKKKLNPSRPHGILSGLNVVSHHHSSEHNHQSPLAFIPLPPSGVHLDEIEMRNFFAHSEVESLHGKIKDGSATDAEKMRYQELLSQHAQLHPDSYEARVARAREYAGYSINPSPTAPMTSTGPVPIAPNGPLPDKNYGARKYRSKKPSQKTCAMPYVRPIATIMSKAKGAQDKVVFYDMYPAAHLQKASSPPVQIDGANQLYHVKLIEPTKETKTTTTATTTTRPSSPAQGQKRVHAPVPIRQEPAAKHQKMENPAAASAPAKGILRNNTPTLQPPTRRQPSLLARIDPTAFLRAMRASAATRGQQEHILTALRASSASSSSSSSSNDGRRSAFDSLQKRITQDLHARANLAVNTSSRSIEKAFVRSANKPAAFQPASNVPELSAKKPTPTAYRSRSSSSSQASSPPTILASPPAQNSASPPAVRGHAPSSDKPLPPSTRSVEEETKMRRLAGMKSTTAMLTQTLPPDLIQNAIKFNPSMSTTHLLRRFGNPHRRVVHQLLRDQNEKIIREMKKRQLAHVRSSGTSQAKPAKPATASSVAVESK
jgi:hypothetical protein